MRTTPKKPYSRKKVKGVYFRKDREGYWFSRQIGKKRTFIDLETTNYVEAVERAAKLQDAPELRPGGGLHDLAAQFLALKLRRNEFSENTAKSQRDVLLPFAARFKNLQPHQIGNDEAKQYYEAMRKKCAAVTVNAYISKLSTFFNWLMEERKVRTNPFESLGRRKCRFGTLDRVDQMAKIRYVLYEDFQKLIADAPTDELRFILYCGFHAGMRMDEIISSRPEWFDLKGGVIRITSTEHFRQKDREAVRLVPISIEFQRFLRDFPRDTLYMLRPEVAKGKHRYRWDFRRPYLDYMIAKGFRWCSPHIMRHSFASHAVFQGESLSKVASWLGDGIRVVEKHYAHLRPDDRSIDRVFPAPISNLVILPPADSPACADQSPDQDPARRSASVDASAHTA